MTVEEALKAATLYSDNQLYKFVKLPPNAITVAASIVAEAGIAYFALLVDKDEVTLMLPDDVLDVFSKRLIDAEISETHYRLITFDVVLEPTLVGFMAHISTALAQENISIMPFAAYSRDHLFVSDEQFDLAINILERLKLT